MLANEAIRNFLNGESLVFGYPGTPDLKNVSILLHEDFISYPPSNLKDAGLDVISWKSFEDDRSSQIVILTQCAAGNNWKSKAGKLPVEAWREYIHWACRPVIGFGIPRIISKTEFHQICVECNCALLFDRARIYRNTESSRFESDLRNKFKSWCQERLRNLD